MKKSDSDDITVIILNLRPIGLSFDWVEIVDAIQKKIEKPDFEEVKKILLFLQTTGSISKSGFTYTRTMMKVHP